MWFVVAEALSFLYLYAKPKEHSTLLERCLQLWHEGKIGDLVSKGCAIQSRLPSCSANISDSQLVRSFANLMFEGKTSAAHKLITGHQLGCLLQLNNQIDPSNPNCLVHDILKEKHPPAQPLSQDCLISEVSESAPFHLIIFEVLNGPMIQSAALGIFGAASVSGVDARS